MGGVSKIQFMNRPGEDYLVTYPNIYARGILFGTMYVELGDTVTIKCANTNLSCDIEFKVKGFFTGTYNALSGKVRDDLNGQVLYNITGKWSETLYIQKPSSQNKDVFFNVATSKLQPKIVEKEAKMNEFESRLLWSKVTKAIQSKNLDLATEEKSAIENNQRLIVKNRLAGGAKWESQFFDLVDCVWKFRCPISEDQITAKNDIKSFIFNKPRLEVYERFWYKDPYTPAAQAQIDEDEFADAEES